MRTRAWYRVGVHDHVGIVEDESTVLFEFGHVEIKVPKERLAELSLRRKGDAGDSRPAGSLADALWAARRARGFARARVAEEIGVSGNTIYRWETGHTRPVRPRCSAWHGRTGCRTSPFRCIWSELRPGGQCERPCPVP